MSRNTFISEALYSYLLKTTSREPEIMARLREETARRYPPDKAQMQIGPDQAQFMALLARIIGAEKTLEIGVFTGYSSLAIALAIPLHGRIFACDIDDEYTSLARRYWEEAGVLNKFALRICPAVDSLQNLVNSGQSGTFDFAFIDADKTNYDNYYEFCIKLVRPGGLILVDNTLWAGNVANKHLNDEDTVAIRQLNAKIGKDERVEQSLLTIGDGLTVARKL
jgi:predicted O-methyltransferase YrrM